MRQPVFGRGVNPGLGLADFSGIERGGAAMGSGMAMGLASLGAGMEKGRAERHDMERQVRSAEATLKALGKRENLDDGLRDIATGLLDAISDPNSPLRDRAATAGTANQSIDQFLKLGAFEMEKKQAEEQNQMLQLQRQQAQQDQAMGQQNMEQEQRVLKQLQQYQQGIGSGVLRPEVTAGLAELDRSNPQASFAARQGVSLDVAERVLPPSAQENQVNFISDPETGNRFVTFGKSIIQLPPENSAKLTKVEEYFEAIDRLRTAAGRPKLTPDEKAEGAEIYTTGVIEGRGSEDLFKQMFMRSLMPPGSELPSSSKNRFNAPLSSPGSPAAASPPENYETTVNNVFQGLNLPKK